jgi:chromosome transmission fidelity protein 1
VLVFGLPFANNQSLQIQEKMLYYDKQGSDFNGKEYYENLCMRVLNQAIGRALRHAKDYACIAVLDQRICRLKTKLPQWIQ